MRKHLSARFRKALGGVLIIAAMAAPAAPSAAQTGGAVQLVDAPFPPYIEGEYDGKPTGGIVPRILAELEARTGHELRLTLHPWKRVLKMVRLGQADGVSLLMRTAERETFLRYTTVLLESRESLYYNTARLEGFQWRTFRDLEGYRIGLVDGYTYGQPFMEALSTLDLTVEYAGDTESAFRMLAAGRVDLVLEDDAVASSLLAANPSWQDVLDRAEQPVAVYPFHMAFSRKSPAADLVPEIDRAIEAMQSDGTLKSIISAPR